MNHITNAYTSRSILIKGSSLVGDVVTATAELVRKVACFHMLLNCQRFRDPQQGVIPSKVGTSVVSSFC